MENKDLTNRLRISFKEKLSLDKLSEFFFSISQKHSEYTIAYKIEKFDEKTRISGLIYSHQNSAGFQSLSSRTQPFHFSEIDFDIPSGYDQLPSYVKKIINEIHTVFQKEIKVL